MGQEEYIKERVDGQIKWFSGKSRINKKYLIGFRTSIIIMSSSIPFLSGIHSSSFGMESVFFDTSLRQLIGLIGALIAIFTALIGFMKYQENWTQYRLVSEQLQNEKIMFLTKTGAYKNSKNPFEEFVERIEQHLSYERNQWKEYILQEGENDG